MQYYVIVHTTISERYDRKQNSHNSDVQKKRNDRDMKNNKRNNNSTKRRNNNHYQNQERKRNRALEQAKQDLVASLKKKDVRGDEETSIKVENSIDKFPNTVFTSLKTPQPSEVTSDSNLEVLFLKEQLQKKEKELEEMKSNKRVKRVRKKIFFTQLD